MLFTYTLDLSAGGKTRLATEVEAGVMEPGPRCVVACNPGSPLAPAIGGLSVIPRPDDDSTLTTAELWL